MQVHGKTAVLVERIINKILNENIDIDRLLVVTFTNAAASEMRERIAKKLYEEIPNNPSLSNQLRLLSKASITTIDSFCNRVVKDNFFKLGIDPNFRIADSGESEILKLEALEELFEEKYESSDEEFINLFNMYGSNKDDNNLKSLILKIHTFTRSLVNPEKWLQDKLEVFKANSVSDFAYCDLILKYSKSQIENAITEFKALLDDLDGSELCGNYLDCISRDIENLKLLSTKTNSWDEFYEAINNFDFARVSSSKGVPEEIKEQINKVRDAVKKTIRDDIKGTFFIFTSDEIINDNQIIYKNLSSLIKLELEFIELLQAKKLEKNILDFSDIEHYANRLLNDYEDIAKFYKDKFVEILIDEYQDSNLLQESILTAISNDRMFMVGDVKQSIYRFRNARPELFLEKYNTYSDNPEDKNQKVLLFKNFRSNENIVYQVNYIFERIMSKDFGELDYTEKEFLKFGADCYSRIGEKAELTLIETNLNDETLELPEEAIFDTTANIEGRYIAKRIKELVGNMTIYDKSLKCERPAQYKDIAILLRSTTNKADGILEELSNAGIPVYSEKGGSYFDNTEVQTILSVLRIIDNPIQDIPLVAVMRSQIGGFSIDELTSIRLCDRKSSFYDATIKSLNQENELSTKVKVFLDKLHKWREISKHISLWELLWQIYNETGYYYYVSLFPDGLKRQANLNLLLERAESFEKTSFKGLFNFLSYIDNIKETSADFGESKQIGEGENVVRLMSVHKSKGLEFPIVILAGTEKRFNAREYTENIILDQDYGFGVDIIDYEKRFKYANISKHAITIKSKMDSVAEEMRILYVALTRAREKLIVTGLVSNLQDAISKYGTDITKFKISKAHSFLDWLGLCIVNKVSDWQVIKVPFEDSYNTVEAPLGHHDGTEPSDSEHHDADSSMYDFVERQMSWVYHNDVATKLPNKVSISELKRAHIEDEEGSSLLDKNNVKALVSLPNFLSDDEESGTKYGTLVHNTMQKLDFKNYDEDGALNIIKTLTLDQNTQNSILRKVKAFAKTDLFNDLKDAKVVYKETSFNLNISAKEVYKVETNEKVMIQGIIDLYYIDKNDNLVLVDYKTDKVETEQELVDRYRIQLELYKRALEEILDKPVSKTLIYSFKFEKSIELSWTFGDTFRRFANF